MPRRREESPQGSPVAQDNERVSFGDERYDFPGHRREVHLTRLRDGVAGITTTADVSGELRLVRVGSAMSGYSGTTATGIYCTPVLLRRLAM